MLNIDCIRTDGETQSRVELNQETVAEYAEAYRNGADFPPVTVFYDGENRWLADGFHRYAGAQAAGKTQILEHIIPGTRRDAILYSFKANSTHGLKRTNADKRKAVSAMLADPEWSSWSQERIAKACGVSTGFVSKLVNDPSLHREEIKPDVRTVERNGKAYQQDTSNIGKAAKQAAPGYPRLGQPLDIPAKQAEPSANSQTSAPATQTNHAAPVLEPDPEEYGPSEEEIATALKEEADEIAMLRRIAASDDKIAAALAEAKQLRAVVRGLQRRIDGLMNETNEAIEQAKKWKSKYSKLEKQLKVAA